MPTVSCHDNLLAQTLEQCLRLADQGLPIETFLATSLELRGDLEPLVHQAVGLLRVSWAMPSLACRSAARERIVRYAAAHAQRSSGPFAGGPVPHLRYGAAAAATAGALMVSSGLANASSVLPGGPLDPVKLAVADAQIALAPNPSARLDLNLRSAERRIDELSTLLANGRAVGAKPAADDFARRIAAVAGSEVISPEHAKATLDRRRAAPDETAREVLNQAIEASAAARTQARLSPLPDTVALDAAAVFPTGTPTVIPVAIIQPAEAPNAPEADSAAPLEAVQPEGSDDAPADASEPIVAAVEDPVEAGSDPAPAAHQAPPAAVAPRPASPSQRPVNPPTKESLPAASAGKDGYVKQPAGRGAREPESPASTNNTGPEEHSERNGHSGNRGRSEFGKSQGNGNQSQVLDESDGASSAHGNTPGEAGRAGKEGDPEPKSSGGNSTDPNRPSSLKAPSHRTRPSQSAGRPSGSKGTSGGSTATSSGGGSKGSSGGPSSGGSSGGGYDKH